MTQISIYCRALIWIIFFQFRLVTDIYSAKILGHLMASTIGLIPSYLGILFLNNGARMSDAR